MKQITIDQVEKLAISENALRSEIRYCQVDWIKENASMIASIETKFLDKTACGEFPRGWKYEMVQESKKRARKMLVDQFINANCKVLDGVIWLNSWDHILELKRIQNKQKSNQ